MDGFYKLIIALLKQHGFEYWRNGKGSHEIWRKSLGGGQYIHAVVPRSTKSRFTANQILRQAGIEERL